MFPVNYGEYNYLKQYTDWEELLLELESNGFLPNSEHVFTKTFSIGDAAHFLTFRLYNINSRLYCDGALSKQDGIPVTGEPLWYTQDYRTISKWEQMLASVSDISTMNQSLFPARKLLEHILQVVAEYTVQERKKSIQTAGDEYSI